MRPYYLIRDIFWLLVLLIIVGILLIAPARAVAPIVTLTTAFEEVGPITLGHSLKLTILIQNYNPNTVTNPATLTSLQCSQQGSSLLASPISPAPSSTQLMWGEVFYTTQSYIGIAPGTTTVTCIAKGVDAVTGEAFTLSSAPASMTVAQAKDARLTMTAYSATRRATVGQDIFLMVVYTNRGKTTLTNVEGGCGFFGTGTVPLGRRFNLGTLRPGESAFTEVRERAVSIGSGYYFCNVLAFDVGSPNPVINLSALPIPISIVR